MKEVRTRFAPSPTGFMHVGNLRTALYEYLIAKSLNGKFVLRIEDTDQERLVEGAVDVIYDTLKQVGIVHDEGPDVGGPYGPYVQSQRKDMYLPYAQELVKNGKAYYCFCSKERLDSLNEGENQSLPQFITGGSGQAFKRRRTVCNSSKNACYRFHDICRCGLRRNHH